MWEYIKNHIPTLKKTEMTKRPNAKKSNEKKFNIVGQKAECPKSWIVQKAELYIIFSKFWYDKKTFAIKQ